MTFQRYSPIGIEISGGLVRMIQLSRSRAQTHLHAWAVFPRIEPESSIDLELPRIAGVIERRGFVGRDAALVLPDESTLSAVFDLPPLQSGAPVGTIARVEMGRMFKHAPDDLEVALWELPTTARAAGAAASMVVACPHAISQPIGDAFDSHNLLLRVMEPRSVAIVRACAPRTAASESIEIVLSLGWNQSRFYAISSGVIVLERAVENADLETLCRVVGGTIGVETDLGECALADALRTQRTMVTDPDAVREIQEHARHFTESLATEALTAVSYLTRRFTGRKATRLLVVSDSEVAPDLARDIAARLSVDSRVCSLADLPIGGAESLPPAARRALLATAGLCLPREGGTPW